MRLIDADKIDFSDVFVGTSDFANDARIAAQMLIEKQPTVNTKKHGRWSTKTKSVLTRNGYTSTKYTVFVCSVCGSSTGKDTTYCPNCGALMDLD